jgi:hypothetical protein
VSWQSVALVGFNTAQVIALAWIVAWQQRAAHERRKDNAALPGLIAEKVNGASTS